MLGLTLGEYLLRSEGGGADGEDQDDVFGRCVWEYSTVCGSDKTDHVLARFLRDVSTISASF